MKQVYYILKTFSEFQLYQNFIADFEFRYAQFELNLTAGYWCLFRIPHQQTSFISNRAWC